MYEKKNPRELVTTGGLEFLVVTNISMLIFPAPTVTSRHLFCHADSRIGSSDTNDGVRPRKKLCNSSSTVPEGLQIGTSILWKPGDEGKWQNPYQAKIFRPFQSSLKH